MRCFALNLEAIAIPTVVVDVVGIVGVGSDLFAQVPNIAPHVADVVMYCSPQVWRINSSWVTAPHISDKDFRQF